MAAFDRCPRIPGDHQPVNITVVIAWETTNPTPSHLRILMAVWSLVARRLLALETPIKSLLRVEAGNKTQFKVGYI
jgi:hypothetical protein